MAGSTLLKFLTTLKSLRRCSSTWAMRSAMRSAFLRSRWRDFSCSTRSGARPECERIRSEHRSQWEEGLETLIRAQKNRIADVRARLGAYAARIRALGARKVADLQLLSDEDIDDLGVPKELRVVLKVSLS
mgnify:CR=1 FL=1